MAIWTPMLLKAARTLMNDPRVRDKAKDILEHEVVPRAEDAWRKTKPKLDAARDDLRAIAKETDPRENPKDFAKKVKQHFVDRRTRD